MARYFVSYWPRGCSEPTSKLEETGIKQSLLTMLRNTEEKEGPVIFFHKLKDGE